MSTMATNQDPFGLILFTNPRFACILQIRVDLYLSETIRRRQPPLPLHLPYPHRRPRYPNLNPSLSRLPLRPPPLLPSPHLRHRRPKRVKLQPRSLVLFLQPRLLPRGRWARVTLARLTSLSASSFSWVRNVYILATTTLTTFVR